MDKTEDQHVDILRGMGFDWKFIGAVTDLKPGTAQKRYDRNNKPFADNK